MPAKNGSAEYSATQTIDDLKSLVRDAEEALSSAGDSADEKITELRERMRSALDQTHNIYGRVRESARKQIDQADHYVREHPYQAVGIAAAVGALAGVLVARRFS